MNRRQWLLQTAPRSVAGVALGLLGVTLGLEADAHDQMGPVVPPVVPPALPLTLHDGRVVQLPALLQGRITALQLMFVGCSATCPVQGALFAALGPLVAGALPGTQLLSLTISPLSDDAAALAAWRKRFGAGPAWNAAAPMPRHADVMQDSLEGRGKRGANGDRHRTQTYLFDRQGRLAFRCAELASPRDMASAMFSLAAR